MLGRNKTDEKAENEKLKTTIEAHEKRIAELEATVHGHDTKHEKMNHRMKIKEDSAEDMHDKFYVVTDILQKIDFELVNDINERMDILRRERKERRKKEREEFLRSKRY